MRKIRVMNGLYMKPECNVINIELQTNLLEGSTGGGHNGADDEEGLNSKQGGLFEEELDSKADNRWN